MSTVDSFSSPDPLQEIEGSIIPSSARPVTRSITRSQVPPHFFSLASSTQSPRKRTFELDVGDERSPQKILVTVEAGDSSQQRGSSSVNRRLFQEVPTPTPRRVIRGMEKATTTSVPLRGLTDDEGGALGATPRRRGRPSKSGTPVTTTRKRAGTPAKSTAKPRKIKAQDDMASDVGAADSQATPRATQKRSPGKRKASTPAKAEGPPKKRGRPRKAILPDEFQILADAESGADAGVEDNASLAATGDIVSLAPTDDNGNASQDGMDDNYSAAGSLPPAPSDSGADEPEEDIWMANLSDAPTPVVGHRWTGREQADVSHISNPALPEEEPMAQYAGSQRTELEQDDAPGDLFMELAEADPRSPESHISENVMASEQDTVMAGEGFTMISIGSLPSMQPNSSIMGPPQEELGEATSLIISRTLESLRQSQGQGYEQTDQELSFSAQDEVPPPETADHSVEASLLLPPEQSMFPQPSPSQSPRRSPRRAKSQTPLGRQLALKSLQSVEKAVSPTRPSLALPPAEPRDASMLYDDSFSEIPDAVLDAATPRPPRQQYVEMEDTEEEEELDLIIAPSVERSNSTVNPPSHPQSETNRLLTPDETPSPIASEHGVDNKTSEHEAALETDDASPAKSSHVEILRSSPPVIEVQGQQHDSSSVIRHRSHSRNLSLETPIEQIPTVSPPRANFSNFTAPRASLAPPEIPNRRTLSPIMRAGRALQMVTSDPPSPPRQGSALRSPFRGSVRSTQSPVLSAARITKSPTPPAAPSTAPGSAQTGVAFSAPPSAPPSIPQQTESTWTRAFAPLSQIKNLVVQGAQAFSSPRVAPTPTPAPATVSVPTSVPTSAAHLAEEDPFASNLDEASRAESLRNSIFGSSVRAKSPEAKEQTPSAISSTRADVPSLAGEDEMSWMADDSTPAPRIEMFNPPGSVRSSSAFESGGSAGGQDDDMDVDANEQLQDERLQDERLQDERLQDERLQDEQLQDEQLQDEQLQAEQHQDEQLQEEREEYPIRDEDDNKMDSYSDMGEEPQDMQDQTEEEEEELDVIQDEEGEDDDIWAVEASRPTPRSSRTLGKAPPRTFNRSSWRQSNKAKANDEPEEFSMLSQLSRNESAMGKDASQLASAKKTDLSAFFSSPAPLPDVQPFGLLNALNAKRPENEKPTRKIAQPSRFFQGLGEKSAEQQRPAQAQHFGMSTIHRPVIDSPSKPQAPPVSQGSRLFSTAREQETQADRPPQPSRRAQPFGGFSRTRSAELEDNGATQENTQADEGSQPSRRAQPFGGFSRTRSAESEDNGTTQASRPSESFGLLDKALGAKAESSNPFGAVQAPKPFGLGARRTATAATNTQAQASRRSKGLGLFNTAESRETEDDTIQSVGAQKVVQFAPQSVSALFQVQRPQSEELRHVPQKDFRIGNRRSVDLFSPVKPDAIDTREKSQSPPLVEHSSSPVTPEQAVFAQVPQKRNFTPRQRQFSNKPLFKPGQAGAMNSFFGNPVSDIRQTVEPQDESMAMDNDQESSFITPELKPLPGRAASPSKSCIRSPLKAKTPGRVVEFTSSTLSPLQQAQVRAERRASASPEKETVVPTAVPAPALFSSKISVTSSASEEDKENQTSGSEQASDFEHEISKRPAAAGNLDLQTQTSTTFTSQFSAFGASFRAQPLNEPLSQTTWTKAHWVRLDALLQERRTSGTLPFQLKNAAVAQPAARRPSRKLLGKQVSAHVDTMVVEQWHLDVVDAFKAEVGGWEEGALVKRLFALMVGEERRKKGLVPNIKNGKRVFF